MLTVFVPVVEYSPVGNALCGVRKQRLSVVTPLHVREVGEAVRVTDPQLCAGLPDEPPEPVRYSGRAFPEMVRAVGNSSEAAP